MVKRRHKMIFFIALLASGYVLCMDQCEANNALIGQIIHLPLVERVGGKVEQDYLRVFYPIDSIFCRHSEGKIWAKNEFCFCMANKQDDAGNTPLYNAIQQGDEHAVKCLLGLGALTLIPNNKGETPFGLVRDASYSHGYIARWVISAYNKEWRFYSEVVPKQLFYPGASFYARVLAQNIDKNSLKNCFSINWKDDRGYTAAHILVMQKQATLKQLQLLVEYGADVTIRANYYQDDENVHKAAIRHIGRTPVGELKEGWEYHGDPMMANYALSVGVTKKLEAYLKYKEMQEKLKRDEAALYDMLGVKRKK